MRSLVALLVAAVALAASAGAAHAQRAPAAFTFQASGGPGWRAALTDTDRSPGFDAISGGGDLLFGLHFGGVGLALGGRGRGGKIGDRVYAEAAGDLDLIVFLGDRVRARAGFAAGQSWVGDRNATFIGGLLGVSFDLVQFAGGRSALLLAIRLDLDGFLGDDPTFPRVSIALDGGIGVRY
jgi:hypothetical protein